MCWDDQLGSPHSAAHKLAVQHTPHRHAITHVSATANTVQQHPTACNTIQCHPTASSIQHPSSLLWTTNNHQHAAHALTVPTTCSRPAHQPPTQSAQVCLLVGCLLQLAAVVRVARSLHGFLLHSLHSVRPPLRAIEQWRMVLILDGVGVRAFVG